jgi:hypothetical protein
MACECVKCIQLAQDRVQWWDLVNLLMNLWLPQETDNFLIGCVSINY